MEKNRTINRTDAARKNITVGIVSKIILLLASFVSRTLFIRILGVEYTGISSLFTNILGLLNLAELGLGSVFTFELYGLLRERDIEKICIYVALFKKIYCVIAAVICLVGFTLIPFLKVITHSELPTYYLIFYYLLYLLDSIASYIAVSRTSVIEADQKRYVTQYVDIASKFAQYIIQIIYLVHQRDFGGYLCIQVFFTILRNILLNWLAGKMYPFLKNKTKVRLDEKSIHAIIQNVKATFISRLSDTIMTQTDSIIISALIGVVAVGYYSNYNMIVVYINSIICILFSAIEASVGNLNAERNVQKSYCMFRNLSVWFSVLNAFCIAAYICLIQNFIVIWIGDSYIQPLTLIVCIVFTFYVNQTMNVLHMYQRTMGLFREMQAVYPVMTVLNVFLSVWLGKIWGIEGVILATGISKGMTTFWYEGRVVFSKLGHSFKEYLLQQSKFLLYTMGMVAISYWLCEMIPQSGFMDMLGRGCIVVVVCILFSLIFWGNTEEWKWGLAIVRKKVGKV